MLQQHFTVVAVPNLWVGPLQRVTRSIWRVMWWFTGEERKKTTFLYINLFLTVGCFSNWIIFLLWNFSFNMKRVPKKTLLFCQGPQKKMGDTGLICVVFYRLFLFYYLNLKSNYSCSMNVMDKMKWNCVAVEVWSRINLQGLKPLL